MRKVWLVSLLLLANLLYAERTIEPVVYGDMDQWLVRYIKESALLGGKTQTIYVLAPTDTIKGNKAFAFDNNNYLW